MTDVSELAALISRLTLANVRCVGVSAALASEEVIPPSRIVIEIADNVTYALDDAFLGGRYTASAVMYGPDGDEVAKVETVHVIEHALAAGDAPTSDTVSRYLIANGLFIVYPYVRQAIQDAFQRIGHGHLVLGILTREQAPPIRVEISLIGEPEGQD